MNVPFVDLRQQNAEVCEEILATWTKIMHNASFVGGKIVDDFEEAFANACGASNCVAVSSGTDALIAGLFALDVTVGDEVILPANTFIATAEAVQALGAKPVLVDCINGTWNIDPDQVQAVITKKTVGIIGVHLYGQPCDMTSLRTVADANNVWLMEDAAQAHLATLNGRVCGSLGDIAAFSFYPGKNLGAPGEGGAVVTSNADYAARSKMFINHGSSKKYHHELFGINARLPTVMASALAIKLRHLARWTACRRNVAKFYLENLDNTKLLLPNVMKGSDPAWHLFVVHANERDRLAAYLNERGISTGLHYPIPIHLQPQFSNYGYGINDFPNAEFNAKNCLSLPIFECMNQDQQRYVVNVINEFEV